MTDLVIKNGKVVDFESGIIKECDICIEDGKISFVGKWYGEGKKEIDAKGNIVSSGFIDIHMHEEVIGNGINGEAYDIANYMLLMGVTTCVGGNCGDNYMDVKDFFEYVDKNGSPVSYLLYSGHNTMREKIGLDRYGTATKSEIEKMSKYLKEDFDNGAIGISFGIEYSPGVTQEEIVNVTNVLKDYDILLAAHYRKDVMYGLKSAKELIAISNDTKKPMQISHLGSCSGFGCMKETLEAIDRAVKNGIDVKADCYPYAAFSTKIGTSVFDEGCFESWGKTYEDILLTEDPYRGFRCTKELFYEAREKYPEMIAVAFVMNEDEVVEALKSPHTYVASDGLYRKGQGHPRGAGTFPRILGKYVREDRSLTLIDALNKMTKLPAERLKLKNKGQIKEGMDGDIVIFNPDTIIDCATFVEPTLPPKGIEYVIVGGEIAVKGNKIINNRLGKSIRRKELDIYR